MAQIHGLLDLPAGEYNVLVHALNEELDESVKACGAAEVPFRQVRAEEGLRRRYR